MKKLILIIYLLLIIPAFAAEQPKWCKKPLDSLNTAEKIICDNSVLWDPYAETMATYGKLMDLLPPIERNALRYEQVGEAAGKNIGWLKLRNEYCEVSINSCMQVFRERTIQLTNRIRTVLSHNPSLYSVPTESLPRQLPPIEQGLSDITQTDYFTVIPFVVAVIVVFFFVILYINYSYQGENEINKQIKLAKQGNAEAQFKLGMLYSQGKEVERNLFKAAQWYSNAARQGHAAAQCHLGLLLQKDYQDFSQAIHWYQESAEQGYHLAQYHLGECYYNGQGVPRNFVEAYKWFLLASMERLESAVLARENIESHLEPVEKMDGQRLAKEWFDEYQQKILIDKGLLSIQQIYNDANRTTSYQDRIFL